MGRQDFDPALKGAPEAEIGYPVEPFNGSFNGKDIVSVEQFTQRGEIEKVFTLADEMKRSVRNHEVRRDLAGYMVVELFYQPSSRTYSSFLAAAQRLSAYTVPLNGMTAYSSAAKGETLSDTVRTFEATTAADVIVLRHPEDSSSEEAAYYAEVPIINAGAGRREHPTQGILDLYTIREELKRTDDLTITMIGDLRNGRTIKSLAKLMVLMGDNLTFNFVSPDVLQMPQDVNDYLRSKGAKVNVGGNGDLKNALSVSDALYVTRIQGEWFTTQALEDLRQNLGPRAQLLNVQTLADASQQLGKAVYDEAVQGYVVDADLLDAASPKMIVMHPLPRVGEIAREVDRDPRQVYLKKQMENGLFTRMAELALVTGKAEDY